MQFDFTPLHEIFAQVPDPRHAQGKRHPLPAILSLMCVATLCGYKTYSAMVEWGKYHGSGYLRMLGFTRDTPPVQSTLCALLQGLDAQALEAAIGQWIESVVATLPPDRVEAWALDGKTLRGSKKQGADCFHLVAILGHQCGMVLRQELAPLRGDKQPDEGAVVNALLKCLFQEGTLEGRIWTMDALHTREDNAQTIVDGGGDYVMPVKENQPTLCADIRLLFDERDRLAKEKREAMTATAAWDQGHGRIEHRRLTVSAALNDHLDWPGVGQVFRVERVRYQTKSGQTESETVYGITSLSPEAADAERLASLVRGHWSIENRLHYVRDVTFGEDRSHVRSRATPQVMAAIRNVAISLLHGLEEKNIAAATRRLGARPMEAMTLIGVQP